MFKRAIYIFLLLAFLYASMANYLYLGINIELNRQLVKYKLESNNELVVLRFAKKDYKKLVWVHEHEFIFKGEYYDVSSVENIGEQIVIACRKDKEEEKLIDLLGALFDQTFPLHSNQKQNLKLDLLKFITANLILFQDRTFNPIGSFLVKSKRKNYSDPILENFSPPPEMMS